MGREMSVYTNGGAVTEKATIEIIDGPDYRRDEQGWEHHAYTLRVYYGDRYMDTPWKQGLGITDDPDIESVLESLASDAAGYVNAQDFEDWASEYGYDTDSRKAFALYEEVGRQTDNLRGMLAEDFDAIVFPES